MNEYNKNINALTQAYNKEKTFKKWIEIRNLINQKKLFIRKQSRILQNNINEIKEKYLLRELEYIKQFEQLRTEKIKYGYTFDYINISQSNFKFIEKFYWKSENTDLQETSLGVSAGGNCTLQFNKFFKMTLNAKYNPAYSKLNIDGVDYSYDLKGFSNSLLFGCDFSFKFIGTGIEYKISGVKYKLDNVQKDDHGINPVFINKLGTDKGNIISNYLNIYLTFNF